MKWLGHIFSWLGRRLHILLSLLLLIVLATIVWLTFVGISPETQGIANGIAMLAAVFAAISAYASLAQVVEQQKASERLDRPYIQAYFQDESTGLITFVIENVGNSPAYNTRIQFNPSPVDFHERPISEVSLFSVPIQFIPPGKRYRQILEMGFTFFEKRRPTEYEVAISYSSALRQNYAEKIKFDLAYLQQANVAPKDIEGYLKDLSETSKKTSKELEEIKRLIAQRK